MKRDDYLDMAKDAGLPRLRRILEIREAGKTYLEIATVEGVTESAIGKLVKRAKDRGLLPEEKKARGRRA